MDTTLLALAGAGFSRRNGGASAFGFMSCERAVGAAEGMNVVQERKRWLPDNNHPEGGSGMRVTHCRTLHSRYVLLCSILQHNPPPHLYFPHPTSHTPPFPRPTSHTGGRYVFEYGVTNVEYTEFEKLGLNDEAVSAGSKTSVFPANTNVLYVGLKGARSVVAEVRRRMGGGRGLGVGLKRG